MRDLRSARAVYASCALASAVAAAVLVASPSSAQVAFGITWYSDGTQGKAGPQGTQIKAYAVGALPDVPYQLVLGNDGNDPGHASHACMATVDVLNSSVIRAGSNGLIATVTGTVHNVPPGTYQLCFKDSSSNNLTGTGGTTFVVL